MSWILVPPIVQYDEQLLLRRPLVSNCSNVIDFCDSNRSRLLPRFSSEGLRHFSYSSIADDNRTLE